MIYNFSHVQLYYAIAGRRREAQVHWQRWRKPNIINGQPYGLELWNSF